ncbi:hypothetical protein GCM10009096_23950 [Parasphingorhabdus litoris]|uniref:Uncharacterized protein n=1 Tax=Parasphingorhabdus litoris TaxID=394733 RepID=A0ABN1AP31_9SPHN
MVSACAISLSYNDVSAAYCMKKTGRDELGLGNEIALMTFEEISHETLFGRHAKMRHALNFT